MFYSSPRHGCHLLQTPTNWSHIEANLNSPTPYHSRVGLCLQSQLDLGIIYDAMITILHYSPKATWHSGKVFKGMLAGYIKLITLLWLEGHTNLLLDHPRVLSPNSLSNRSLADFPRSQKLGGVAAIFFCLHSRGLVAKSTPGNSKVGS